MSLSKSEYKQWLRAAYAYYWGEGSEMSDHTWDALAKRVVPEEHDELHGTQYIPGQSLFWLPEAKYPEWAKNE